MVDAARTMPTAATEANLMVRAVEEVRDPVRIGPANPNKLEPVVRVRHRPIRTAPHKLQSSAGLNRKQSRSLRVKITGSLSYVTEAKCAKFTMN